jgi:hypothetical protein
MEQGDARQLNFEDLREISPTARRAEHGEMSASEKNELD